MQLMFYKIKCPVCGDAASMSVFRSRFSTQCEKCDSTLFVDGAMAYWIELVTFIPIYLLVAALIEAAVGRFLGVQATYWHVYPFVVVSALIFHGLAFPKLSSTSVRSKESKGVALN